MTIIEKYYAMNSALNVAMKERGIKCPAYKYGTVAEPVSYPYMQTTYRVRKRQPNGSAESGTLTDFDYILNFFTAAGNERLNDSDLFIPYESARELIINPLFLIFSGIANVLNHEETPEFNYKAGLEVLQRGLVFICQTVVTHVITDKTKDTTIDNDMEVIENAINFE